MVPTTPRPPLRSSVLAELLRAPSGPLARVEVRERVGSTNTELVAAVRADPDAWPDASVLVADHQDQGKGRAGRAWQTPPRAALTFSLALRPLAPPSALGWLPLVAGLAVVTALRATAGVPATLKWPNDILLPAPDGTALDGWGAARKVGGILTELVSTERGDVVVVGIGINVSQQAHELPVASATSLALGAAGVVDREVLLVALVSALGEVGRRWRATAGDVHAAGLADEVAAVCATLGARVRVELPGGDEAVGVAVRLGDDGSLVVRGDDGTERTVLAGDVRHVRGAA